MLLFPERAMSGPSSSPRRNRCGACSRNTWRVERPRNLPTTSSDIDLLDPGLDCLVNQWHPHVGGHFFSKRSVCRSLCREQSQDVERSRLKSLSRANRKSDWQTADVSTLAIVRSKLFSAAKKIQRGTQLCPPGHQRRLRRVLSALLRCGSSGSGMAMDGRDESGHICCSAAVTAACPPDAPGLGAHQRQ